MEKLLIEKVKSGDEKAYEELFNQTYQKAYYTALSITKNSHDAEDVVQNAYIKVLKNIDKLNDPNKFDGWFNVIVANTAKTYVTKKSPVNFSQLDDEENGLSFEESIEADYEKVSPEEISDKKETTRIMGEILSQLSEKQRICIQLFYFNEMKITQIAEALDISENTVKSRLRLGKDNISVKVKEYEKQGVKLYGGIALIPFFFKNSFENTFIPKMTFASIESALSSATVSASATASAADSTATVATAVEKAGVVSVSTAKKAGTAIAAKKIAAVVVSIGIAAGGITAGVVIHNSRKATQKASYIQQVNENDNKSSGNEETTVADVSNESGTFFACAAEYDNKIYYTKCEEFSGEIRCSNKDGSNDEKVLDVLSYQMYISNDTLFYVDETEQDLYKLDLKTTNATPEKINKLKLCIEYADGYFNGCQDVLAKSGNIYYLSNNNGDYPEFNEDSTYCYSYNVISKETKKVADIESKTTVYLTDDDNSTFLVVDDDGTTTYYNENNEKVKTFSEETSDDSEISSDDNSSKVLIYHNEDCEIYSYYYSSEYDYIRKLIVNVDEKEYELNYGFFPCEIDNKIYLLQFNYDADSEEYSYSYLHNATYNISDLPENK